MRLSESPHPFAVVTIVFWSLAYVLTRLALRHFSAYSLGFLRYAVASLVLAATLAPRRLRPPRRVDLPWFLLAGAAGFFGYMIAFNLGCRTVTASTASVVIALVPVFTALMARVWHGERLRVHQWTATGVEFAGVAVLAWMGGGWSVNAGVLWLLLAAFLLGVYNLLQRRLSRGYSGLQSSAYSIFAGTSLLLVFLPTSIKEVRSAPPAQLLYVLVLGIFSSAVAYVCWSMALARARQASEVSNYMFGTPLLASLFGFALTGEVPDFATLIKGSIILLGMILYRFGGKIGRRPPDANRRKETHHA